MDPNGLYHIKIIFCTIRSLPLCFSSQMSSIKVPVLLPLQNKFNWAAHGIAGQPMLSYGPCQFPTLGLIVQRAWCDK